ncbi:MAG: helix-hairpin-helix domain-containing protein [Gammaproteobacteria bacterium]|nr:helix-hairpin-helix domain-containing protein [Gammaproteobacteria bacterium]
MRFYHVFVAILFLFPYHFSFAAGVSSLETKKPTSVQTQPVVSPKPVNINQAPEEDLMRITGMTKSKAKSIIAYRNKQGQFATLDDLSKVKGFKRVKPDKLQAMVQQMTLKS